MIEDFEPLGPDGLVNVVIEIPAGENAKWEVSKEDGRLRWEFQDGEPRRVDYLAYPGSYGMVPQTLLPAADGGDGDPLDVIVLGPAIERGTLAAVRLIGVVQLLDGGERDDKLVAVFPGAPLGQVESMEQLDAEYPGIAQIVRVWFANYKVRGPGGDARVEVQATRGPAAAAGILKAAMGAYRAARP